MWGLQWARCTNIHNFPSSMIANTLKSQPAMTDPCAFHLYSFSSCCNWPVNWNRTSYSDVKEGYLLKYVSSWTHIGYSGYSILFYFIFLNFMDALCMWSLKVKYSAKSCFFSSLLLQWDFDRCKTNMTACSGKVALGMEMICVISKQFWC